VGSQGCTLGADLGERRRAWSFQSKITLISPCGVTLRDFGAVFGAFEGRFATLRGHSRHGEPLRRNVSGPQKRVWGPDRRKQTRRDGQVRTLAALGCQTRPLPFGL
jgi:hypothetical protein